MYACIRTFVWPGGGGAGRRSPPLGHNEGPAGRPEGAAAECSGREPPRNVPEGAAWGERRLRSAGGQRASPPPPAAPLRAETPGQQLPGRWGIAFVFRLVYQTAGSFPRLKCSPLVLLFSKISKGAKAFVSLGLLVLWKDKVIPVQVLSQLLSKMKQWGLKYFIILRYQNKTWGTVMLLSAIANEGNGLHFMLSPT